MVSNLRRSLPFKMQIAVPFLLMALCASMPPYNRLAIDYYLIMAHFLKPWVPLVFSTVLRHSTPANPHPYDEQDVTGFAGISSQFLLTSRRHVYQAFGIRIFYKCVLHVWSTGTRILSLYS